MAVKIRLARHGAKKHPHYRVVVADERMPRDGRFIELIGTYDPMTHPHTINIDLEKVDSWVSKGAQLSDTVSHLVDIVRDGNKPAPEKAVKKSKKQIQKEAAALEEAAAAEAAEAEDAAAPDTESDADAAPAQEEAQEAPQEEKAE